MKQTLKIIFGIALIAVGLLWILSVFGIFSFEFSTEGWWTIFIIVPCLFGLFTDKDKVGPCIGIGMGILLFLAARNIITWQEMGQLAIAVVLIGAGVWLLLFKNRCHHGEFEQTNIIRDGKEILHIQSSFGKQSLSFAGKKFEGADVDSSFGALTLDFYGADIADGAFLNLNVGFSGVNIIVPEGMSVQIAVTSGFGGVTDNRRSKVDTGTSPRLIITGKVGFGGVEIKN